VFVSDIAIFVLKRDVKLQLTNCPDSGPTCMQNFTPISFSAAEKSVTVQIKKQNDKIKMTKLHTVN